MQKIQICISIFMLTCLTNFAQTHLKGRVLDISEKPIPYSNIVVVGEKIGTLSDSLGNFSLMIPKEHQNKTLRVSAIGFKTQEFMIKDLSQKLLEVEVKLKPKTYELEEVVIDKEKPRYIEVGQTKQKSKGLKKLGFGYGSYQGINSLKNVNRQIALLIPNDKNYQGYIKSVSFKFWIESKNKTSFRVRLYKVGENGLPAEDLLPESLITQGKTLQRKHQVDLSKYNLPIPEEGFFVAMEWIYNKQYEEETSIISIDKYGKKTKQTSLDFGQTLSGVITNKEDCNTYSLTGGEHWILNDNIAAKYHGGKCHKPLITATLESYD